MLYKYLNTLMFFFHCYMFIVHTYWSCMDGHIWVSDCFRVSFRRPVETSPLCHTCDNFTHLLNVDPHAEYLVPISGTPETSSRVVCAASTIV